MKKLIAGMLLASLCHYAGASVPGDFVDTNFPSGISGSADGVHRLEIIDNELYAATEKGIYKYSETDDSWSCWALEDVNVIDFKTDGDEIVAEIVPQSQKGFRAVEIATLIRFNRNQSGWEDIMDDGMGNPYYGQILSYIMRLAQHPSKPQTLMVAAYPGIWVSEDFGTSWDLRYDYLYAYNENQFLGWHPSETDVLFYTSESDSMESQILRSGDSGNNWDIINPDPWGDNSCHHMAFDPKDADHILYSGEGCIFESDDCGKTWHCVYRQDSMDRATVIGYAYNVMFDPRRENVVYAVGCDSRNHYIHIFKSTDNGKTWTRIARNDLFDNHENWIYESVLFNDRIYLYTMKGVLAYELGNNTGIVDIMAEDCDAADTLYDLSGRMISNPQTGTIYVKDGKKIIVR